MPESTFDEPARGLAGKNITILGKGNIGSRVGAVAKALDMNVSYFSRGEDLYKSSLDADIVVDALSANSSTNKLLDARFFDSVKPGAVFITVTGSSIVDFEALIDALNFGRLGYVVSDAGGVLSVDAYDDERYRLLLKHPNAIVTPHISYSTDQQRKNCNDMMIDSVEAYINGSPINVVK